jgi:REP element-mobilizing transposase RayT
MTIARSRQVSSEAAGWYHCVSRCVRRAFLCGNGFEHRKTWMQERLELLSRVFAVEIAGFAVMSNHLHVVVRLDPRAPSTWSDEEVLRRWYTAWPRQEESTGQPRALEEGELTLLLGNAELIARCRTRLGDLGWFMKSLKEKIARQANEEDDCTGAFWEGRYKSTALLDQAALIACMAYVDLNPIRAKIATTPEQSEHTSIQARIQARQRYEKLKRLQERAPDRTPILLDLLQVQHRPRHTQDGLWIAPLESCQASDDATTLSVEDYLTLVDETGRLLREGKRGAIPERLAKILIRLDLDVESWLETMLAAGQMKGTAIGNAVTRAAAALQRGLRWICNTCGLFAHQPHVAISP